ncbi:DUF4157 domain-containing protein [Novosphingobium sp. 9U]|uniref:eCIS core domain-containing protein n=1 Tax=Novosphingobium sp. 9U TaxID=2653158 RepID=UPI0012F31311|nr:DUF4157 domain-containing protein [Novosphingobium sp. 9U]VWX50903.1 conserved hypothetical protein [Novosphingobium sp. 9U]
MSSRLALARRESASAPVPLDTRARSGLGAGRALDPVTRSAMETAFGTDLSAVRIHADARADSAARALGAQAYTRGNDIVLSAAHRDLSDTSGRALLSHELAHVVQQRSGGGRPAPAHEAAAHAAASAIASGRTAGPQPGAAQSVQRRVEIRDVGKGEHSGMGRVPELIERLNAISTALIFSIDTDGALQCTENPYGTMTEFDKRIRDFIRSSTVLPLRMTNRHGLMRNDRHSPYDIKVTGDSFIAGYVDIDDVLATDDAALQGRLIHYLTERNATRRYAERMGGDELDKDYNSGHEKALTAERDLLRDYLGDPKLRALDFEQRIFRSSRGDTIIRRTRHLHGKQEGVYSARYEAVIRGTGEKMTLEAYKALLERERAAKAAPAATPAAPGPVGP